MLAATWGAAVLKTIAAVAPLIAVRRLGTSKTTRARVIAWAAAVILTVYGAALTIVGLLVQTGVIARSAHADNRALQWHAYLWDPWFLIWGLLATAALLRSRGE